MPELTSTLTITVNSGRSFLIDSSDKHLVDTRSWSVLKKNGYVYSPTTRRGARDSILLHRLIMGLDRSDSSVVDHINGLPWDNRRCNLRVCTTAENARNTRAHRDNSSGYKGVSWMGSRNKWFAKICIDGRQIYLGLFETAEQGYAAYCKASQKYHGEFGNIRSR